MSLRDILSPTFGNNPNGPSTAQLPVSGSSGKRPQSSGNFFRGAANVNARRQTVNGRRIGHESQANDTMGSLID